MKQSSLKIISMQKPQGLFGTAQAEIEYNGRYQIAVLQGSLNFWACISRPSMTREQASNFDAQLNAAYSQEA